MLFNQTVQLIELTKELERVTVDTLTSTYALGHTYKGAGNYINGAFTRNNELKRQGSYFEEANTDKYYKNMVQGEIDIRGLIAYYNSADIIKEYLPVTVTVSVNGQQIYKNQYEVNNDEDADRLRGKVIDIVDISKYVGTIEIKYYANRFDSGYDLWAQVVYTTQAIADIPNEKPRSVTDVINRVLDVGVACRTQNEKPFYKLDPVYAEMFSKIPAPEYTFTRATLYEVLLEIGTTNNLGAIPSIRLHYSQTHQQSYAIYLRFESSIRLHYSQTLSQPNICPLVFESSIRLHYSQTQCSCQSYSTLFESSIRLHYSQTYHLNCHTRNTFESSIRLHYSQTIGQYLRQ